MSEVFRIDSSRGVQDVANHRRHLLLPDRSVGFDGRPRTVGMSEVRAYVDRLASISVLVGAKRRSWHGNSGRSMKMADKLRHFC